MKTPPAGPTPVGQRNRAATIPARRDPGPSVEEWDDPFDDDEPLVCGIENPDECEACQ